MCNDPRTGTDKGELDDGHHPINDGVCKRAKNKNNNKNNNNNNPQRQDVLWGCNTNDECNGSEGAHKPKGVEIGHV